MLHRLATHFGFLVEWSNQKFGVDKKLNLHIPSNLRCYASQYLHVIEILHKFCFIQKESGIWIEIFACKSSNILAKFPFVFSHTTSSTLYIIHRLASLNVLLCKTVYMQFNQSLIILGGCMSHTTVVRRSGSF